MNLFDVYPRFDIAPVKGQGVYVYDENDTKYLDLYGGHGVISIGHSHPHYVKRMKAQLDKLVFYSNAVEIPLQLELATKLGEISGYSDYGVFFCNSGSEATGNALKVASFHTGKTKVIAFKNSFHGRTAAALNVTDNISYSSPMNIKNFDVQFIEMNNSEQLKAAFNTGKVCSVIAEGIQGVGGLDYPNPAFLEEMEQLCKVNEALLILDEVQSGVGRSGKFFAHQYSSIRPDIITMAKGMGNGFPVGAVLIHPKIKAHYGMLGGTYGGNPMACVASLAVLETLETEHLQENVLATSAFLVEELKGISAIKKVKGKGLMLGLEFDFPIKDLRNEILFEDLIFTGSSSNKNLLRILPPLGITKEEIFPLITSLKKQLR